MTSRDHTFLLTRNLLSMQLKKSRSTSPRKTMFNVIRNFIRPIDQFLDSSTGYRVEHRFICVTSFRVVPQPLLIRISEMSGKSTRLFAPSRINMLIADFGLLRVLNVSLACPMLLNATTATSLVSVLMSFS